MKYTNKEEESDSLDIESQISEHEEEVLEKLAGFLEVILGPDGRKIIQAKYLFRVNPQEVWRPEMSNRPDVVNNTRKIIMKTLTKMSKNDIIALYNRGVDEG